MAAGGAAVVLAASVSFVGCAAQHGVVHPEYAALAPRKVAVLPVRNETLHALDKAAFGGLAQRMTFGPEVHNVPELLRGGLEEALLKRGYELGEAEAGRERDYSQPLPAGVPAPEFEAALAATIELWDADTTGRSSLRMRYRLRLYRVPTAELLYSGTFRGDESGDMRSRGSLDIPGAIRRSAAQALGDLPRAPGAVPRADG